MSFTAWLIKNGVIGYDGLGRLTKQWTADTGNSRRTNRFLFARYMQEKFPDQYIAYLAYIRLT